MKNEWRVLKSGDTISLLPNDLMFAVGVDQDAFKGTADKSDLPSHSKPENSKPIEPIEDLKKDVKVDDEGNAIKRYGCLYAYCTKFQAFDNYLIFYIKDLHSSLKQTSSYP